MLNSRKIGHPCCSLDDTFTLAQFFLTDASETSDAGLVSCRDSKSVLVICLLSFVPSMRGAHPQVTSTFESLWVKRGCLRPSGSGLGAWHLLASPAWQGSSLRIQNDSTFVEKETLHLMQLADLANTEEGRLGFNR